MDVKTLINTRVQELFNLSLKDCSNDAPLSSRQVK